MQDPTTQTINRRRLLQMGAGAGLGVAMPSLAMPGIARASTKTITAVMHAPLRATDPT